MLFLSRRATTAAALALLYTSSAIQAQTTSEPPAPPDCSTPAGAARAQLDCAALARIDMAARHMVTAGYTPGLAVAIVRGGRIVFAQGYGFANVEANLPATPSSVFPILSISKTLTATAVMQLRDAGKLSLDDKVAKYLPAFPRATEVTIRQLLSHTSGIHDTVFEDRRALASDSLVRLIASQPKPYDFAPGAQYAYSNSGYAVLGRIAELVSGRSLRALVRDSVVGRVPFLSTLAVDQATDVVPNRVMPYWRTTVAGRFANAPFVDPSVRFASGWMRSNVLDLANWFSAFFAGKIVSSASVREMTTPAKLNDGRLTGGTWGAYGYGLELARCGGRAYAGHGGATDGGNLVADYYPDDDLMIVIAANSSHTAAALEPQILKQIYGSDNVVGSCH